MFQLPATGFRIFIFLVLFSQPLVAQRSIAREWNESLLQTMEEDLARPHVQARNMFHLSIVLYDAWAAYDEEAVPYMLGKTTDGCYCGFKGIPKPADIEAARQEAMSFAAYRLLSARYNLSPQGTGAVYRFREVMKAHGYDFRNQSTDYSTGSPAALGNYIAQCFQQSVKPDGANETGNYADPLYKALNPPLDVRAAGVGNNNKIDPNHWQPLKFKRAIDQDGYPMLECRCSGFPISALIDSVDKRGRHITGTQTFQGSDWARVRPFALKKENRQNYSENGRESWLYQDPGKAFFVKLDSSKINSTAADYQWGYALVASWSALLNPADTTRWDASPAQQGNIQQYPQNLAELRKFYHPTSGRDPGNGHALNPLTGQAYTHRWVPRADYIRAAVRYWSEGPNSETPAGHWLTLLNYISDQPALTKKFNGKGPEMSQLEWDVKALFVLGSTLHDAAIATWGVKSRYNGTRPISAIRYMGALGQSSNPKLPAYHPHGLPLIPGHIELVKKGDNLAGPKNINLNKIKLFTWKGPFTVSDAATQSAGVGWVLAENWFPYQPQTYITPPHSGFISEHAAFSHAAAEAFTLLTGNAWFPGGLGEFVVPANNQFLLVEQGPSVDVPLQWATYRDAADQASLSRIWGGLNAPFDDIPGRVLGAEVGTAAFHLAKTYFYKDRDRDGVRSYEDCDDNNPAVYPGAPEKCDGLDNDCNGKIDDVTPPCGGGN